MKRRHAGRKKRGMHNAQLGEIEGKLSSADIISYREYI
jgi:hypothetical protein